MATPPKTVILLPGLTQCRAQYTRDPDSGDAVENVLWFLSGVTTSPNIANLNGMANAFDPAWAAMWAIVGAADKSYTGSVWTDFSSTFGLSVTSVGSFTPHPGSNGGNSLPAQNCVLLSYHILERWRGGHPRTYLPYISPSIMNPANDDEITAAKGAAVATAFSAINTATLASGQLGGQSQRIYRNRTNAATAHLMPINSFTCQLRFATQRRRLRKAPHH